MAKPININGLSYDLEKMSPEALAQINNIRAADQEIERLNMQLAFINTARNAYVGVLAKALESASDALISAAPTTAAAPAEQTAESKKASKPKASKA